MQRFFYQANLTGFYKDLIMGTNNGSKKTTTTKRESWQRLPLAEIKE